MKMQSVTYNETVIVAGKIADLKSISGGILNFLTYSKRKLTQYMLALYR